MAGDEGIRDLLRAVRRHGVLVVALAAGAAAIGLATGLAAPRRYTSEALLALPSSPPPASPASDPLATFLIAPPSPAALLQAAQRVASGGLADAAGPDVAIEAVVDEKRGFLVLRASAESPGKARDGAERVARAARAALNASVVAAVRAHYAVLLASTRLEFAGANRALAAARVLAGAGRPALGKADSSVAAGTLEAGGVNPGVARAADPGGAWLRLQTAHFEMQAALLGSRIAGLEELARDPESVLVLVGQGREEREAAPVVLPAVAGPRRVARNAAAGGILGLFVGLAVVFFREASAPQRAA